MRTLFIVGGTLLAVLVVVLGGVGGFSYESVCSRCGAARYTIEWQIPRTQTKLFATSTQHQTPMSRVLRANGLVAPHQHTWVFAHGGGNGVRCALGNGEQVLSTAEDAEVASLIEDLHRLHEWGFRDKVITNSLDNETTHFVRELTVLRPKAPMDAVQLHKWVSEQVELFDESISYPKAR